MKVRHMPRHLIVTLMKEKKVRGLDIGAMAGVSQATFCRVIARKDVGEDLRERVWAALEEVLGDLPAAGRKPNSRRAAMPDGSAGSLN